MASQGPCGRQTHSRMEGGETVEDGVLSPEKAGEGFSLEPPEEPPPHLRLGLGRPGGSWPLELWENSRVVLSY